MLDGRQARSATQVGPRGHGGRIATLKEAQDHRRHRVMTRGGMPRKLARLPVIACRGRRGGDVAAVVHQVMDEELEQSAPRRPPSRSQYTTRRAFTSAPAVLTRHSPTPATRRSTIGRRRACRTSLR